MGGWGDIISDDGSGNAIGRAALRRALWSLEGLAPTSPLADAILDRFGRDPEQMVNWAMGATKTDFARFAPLVFEHAAKGDPLGVALIEEAAGHISRMIARLIDSGACVGRPHRRGTPSPSRRLPPCRRPCAGIWWPRWPMRPMVRS